MEPVVIIGAGGFGREVLMLIQEINQTEPTWDFLGFADDNLNSLDDFPFEHYGKVQWSLDNLPLSQCPNYICAIAGPVARKQIITRLADSNIQWPPIIHPHATVGPGSRLGLGTILCQHSVVTTDVEVGEHVHLNINATIGHDAKVGSFCTLSGHVDICGFANVEEGVFLGSHASIMPKAKVGAWARVGAGSVVLRNVKPETTVFGVPAKRV